MSAVAEVHQPTESEELGFQLPASLGIDLKSCVYVSTPITTGPAFIAWKKDLANGVTEAHRDYWMAHQANVVAENKKIAAPIIARLRAHFHTPLIDPTTLSIPSWTQRDYHNFWCGLIRRWCSTVIMTDGWALSTGCCLEAATAIEEGLTLLDQSLNHLALPDMLIQLAEARRELRSLSLNTEAYEAAINHLLSVIGEAIGGSSSDLKQEGRNRGEA